MRLLKYLVILRKILEYSFSPPKKYFRGEEKSMMRVFMELVAHFLRTGTFNDMYYAFGLNIKGRSPGEYIAKRQINRMVAGRNMELRSNGHIINTSGYDILTKDKFYLSAILKSQGLPVVENVGLISENKIIDHQRLEHTLDHLFQMDMPLLIKNTTLEYNEGILFVERNLSGYLVNGQKREKQQIARELSQGRWIIQDVYRSSESIRKINDTALNTTRIVTVLGKNGPEYLTGFQAFATTGEVTDCWDKRSLYVGFDPKSEFLYERGFYHPAVKGKSMVLEHPESKIVFKDYKIPGLASAVDLCKEAHRYFYYTWLVGWDVAITDDGPKILEANEKPGMNAVQCVNGGLRSKLCLIQNSVHENAFSVK